MGEREKAGPLPGEIVEVYRAALPGGGRDPREVVACYRQPAFTGFCSAWRC